MSRAGKKAEARPREAAAETPPLAKTPAAAGSAAPAGPHQCRWKFGYLLAALGAQIAFLIGIAILAWHYRAPARLVVGDSLAVPGAETPVTVRLTQSGPRWSHIAPEHLKLSFRKVEGPELLSSTSVAFSPLGTAATILPAPAAPGAHGFNAAVEGAGPVALPAGEPHLLLSVLPPDRDLLFVMVPDALVEDGETRLGEGAKEALTALSRERQVVYLGTREQVPAAEVRTWLSASELPQGPVLLLGRGGSVHGAIQAHGVRRWQGNHWGVTRSRSQAQDFAASGIKAFLLSPTAGIDTGESKVVPARSWLDLKTRT